jgi:hypothetical protein
MAQSGEHGESLCGEHENHAFYRPEAGSNRVWGEGQEIGDKVHDNFSAVEVGAEA